MEFKARGNKPLLRVIKIVGSRKILQKMLGVSQQRLDSWLNKDVEMRYEYALILESETKHQVTAAELAPRAAAHLKSHNIKIQLSAENTKS